MAVAASALAVTLGDRTRIDDNGWRMNEVAGDKLAEPRDAGTARVQRRHIIYVSGYDPRGARGYYDLFRRGCERFQQLWPATVTLQQPDLAADDFAHWDFDLRGADWQVATRYEFLRTENFIRADMKKPAVQQALRALGWYADDVVSGAQFRIFRASWRFAVHLLCFQLLALAWTAAAAIVGIGCGYVLTTYLRWPAPFGIVVGLAVGFGGLIAMRPLAQRWRLIQISSCWSTLRRFGRGRPTWIDEVVEAGARGVLAAAHAGNTDELAIVGHSTGGVIASAIVARALELNPDLGKSGPRLVLLTLGSVMPAVALHPAAHRMRAVVRTLAVAKNLVWVDCQSRKDVMCFANFDPVEGVGAQAGSQRCNPLLWRIAFRDMIAPEDYNRFRWNHFRVHYQYILAGDRPAPYDYVLLVGGPMPIAAWPQRDRELMTTFMEDAAPGGARASAAAVIGAVS